MPRFDFKSKPAHTPCARASFFPIFFYSPAGGIEDICMYSAWLRTDGFQYSRNIATLRIVAPLPYFPHANAYMRDHRVRTFPCDFTEYQLHRTTNDRQCWQLCVTSSVSFSLSFFYLLFAEDRTIFLQYYIRLMILQYYILIMCNMRRIGCSLSQIKEIVATLEINFEGVSYNFFRFKMKVSELFVVYTRESGGA